MSRRGNASGLGDLRRSGAVTELLFLYACATDEPTQLRPIAEELGVTVQAVSHSYRQLSKRGLAELRRGRYLPTVRGVAWLHEALGRLGDDVGVRLRRLRVVRTCRAVALSDLGRGDGVVLEMHDGVLSARRGASGPSRGIAAGPARSGELVEVGDLEGILPITPAPVTIWTLSEADLSDPRLPARVVGAVPKSAPGLLAAHGLEAYHALRSATGRPVTRFAVAASSREASQMGVPATVLVLEAELPRLLSEYSGPGSPPIRVRPLGRGRRSSPRRPGN